MVETTEPNNNCTLSHMKLDESNHKSDSMSGNPHDYQDPTGQSERQVRGDPTKRGRLERNAYFFTKEGRIIDDELVRIPLSVCRRLNCQKLKHASFVQAQRHADPYS